jgi:predicted HicB family RNase H-like nuclease
MAKDKDKAREVSEVAHAFYEHCTDWVTFYREMLGVNGVVRKAFTNDVELRAFEQTEESWLIQRWLTELRERSGDYDGKETIRVVTVRMPQSVHESLKREAEDRGTSMNKLAVSKLMQGIDGGLVPKVQVQKEDSSVAAAG